MRPGLCLPRGWLYALGAGQHRLGGRDKDGSCYPVHVACPIEVPRALSESFGNCVLRMLAEGFHSTRLETRTKEYNMHASWWVENP